MAYSKIKAIKLLETGELNKFEVGTFKGLSQIINSNRQEIKQKIIMQRE